MTGAPIADGAVVIAGGVIAAVGKARDLQISHPSAPCEDLGSVILMPGLVNAHAHLELSTLSPGPPPPSFADWLIRLMSTTGASSGPESVIEATQEGIAQCLRFGITTVGDITAHPAITRPVLRESPLRVVSFGEVRAMAARRGLLSARLAAAADQSDASQKLAVGLSPHAPYSIEMEGYRAALELSRSHGLPLTTHLAETADEAEFLAQHTGSLRRVWDWLGAWDDQVPRFPGGPIRFAQAAGLLNVPSLLAHVNYCDDAELDLLTAGRASVVYCPRTHAYFGHPPHRWREMIARGLNVALGTDSCASSPDLNLVDDLRLLRRIAPGTNPLTLWQMATQNAAGALGLEQVAGTLAPGKAADLVAFSVSSNDPLAEVLDQDTLPTAVWIDGRRA